MKRTKLIIGSAGKKTEDAITLDIDPNHQPDVVHDLHVSPLPFEDNQFKEIICHHVLEHLNDIGGAMKELHRICSPEGSIYIEVPHHTSWFANTPGHKLRFNYFAFDEYLDSVDTWNTGSKFTLIRREVTFHRAIRRYFLHRIFNRFPETYERFWAYILPAEHFKIWLRPRKQ